MSAANQLPFPLRQACLGTVGTVVDISEQRLRSSLHLERYEHGVDATVMQFRDAGTRTWEEWYSRWVELVDALGESTIFEVDNMTYRHDPGQFVSNGVVCFYQNRSFKL